MLHKLQHNWFDPYQSFKSILLTTQKCSYTYLLYVRGRGVNITVNMYGKNVEVRGHLGS